MPKEKSAGAIVFRREGKEIKYLLLRKSLEKDYWDFPKGNIEKGESEEETVLREVKEETGIDDGKIIDGFKEKISYVYSRGGKTIFKEVVCFLVETKTKDVKISWEHVTYEWVGFQEVLGKMKSKELIKRANSFLESGLTKRV